MLSVPRTGHQPPGRGQRVARDTVAHGDIWNEKNYFNSFLELTAIEFQSNFENCLFVKTYFIFPVRFVTIWAI